MQTIKSHSQRVLSIYPTSKGFSFVVIERSKKLLDWGTKRSRVKKSQRNKECINRADTLIDEYQPDAVILPEAEDPKRCQRIRNLIRKIARRAIAKDIEVVIVTRDQVQRFFALYGAATRYDRAILIAEWYPPLKQILPRPRRPWETEDGRQSIFDAIVLKNSRWQEPFS